MNLYLLMSYTFQCHCLIFSKNNNEFLKIKNVFSENMNTFLDFQTLKICFSSKEKKNEIDK